MGGLLIPTAMNFLAGGTLYFLFRSNPTWRARRTLRVAMLSLIFIAITVYGAAAIGGSAGLASTAACVLIVLGGYLPIVGHLLTHEFPLGEPQSDRSPSLTWRWSLRRRFLFGSDARRRGLWMRKRQLLPRRSTDPLLRLELLELSLGLGEFEDALYHAHTLDELLPRGEMHAEVLYRLAHILAERQQRLAAAQPTLHRLVRLYPSSEERRDAERLIRLYEQRSAR